MARALPARAQWLLPLLLVVFVAFTFVRLRDAAPRQTPSAGAAQGGATPGRIASFAGQAMGTTYSVKLVPVAGLSGAAAEQQVRAALDAVDAAMSTYRKDSELSRWNAAEPGVARPVSPPLRDVLEVALQVGRASQGALDVTLGPIIDAWGFGPEKPEAPSEARLQELRARTGLDKIELNEAGLRKREPGVRIDLSAVAKGYAVDRAVAALRASGAKQFLVEVGGELFASGHKPDGQPWRVAIERPTPGARAIQRSLGLVDVGLATSGDYRNFYERDGKRLSHLIDPRTARPVSHGLASVSVFHSRVAVADAWATALSVLGPERGVQIAEQQGLSAFFIVRSGESDFRTIETPEFRAQFAKD